jgi:site-specific DNA recombinase
LKQAISYIRISDKDQSNFSITGQQEFIKEYCARKGITLINSFLDNGQSAKNFDRADWKKLEDFVKKNYKIIDHLVVVKYDRFSRNVSEGLAMMDKLEKKYSITILSVFEEIAINPESPFFFKMRTDMLVQAEFELRVIRDRTNFGIRQARKEGRWINRAPFGYVNARDEKDKPILLLDQDRAIIVKKIFDLFSKGTPMSQTMLAAKKMGFNHNSRSALSRILKNPAYVGMIKFDDHLVRGAHEAIIDMATFNRAQSFFKKETQIKVLINDDVPLRGVLRCECGRLLTAGRSRGKTKHYWYYKCSAHLEVNLNASRVHDRFRSLLFDLSLSEQMIDKIRIRSEAMIRERIATGEKHLPSIKRDISAMEKKIAMLEEKFILGQIEFKVYASWISGRDWKANGSGWAI